MKTRRSPLPRALAGAALLLGPALAWSQAAPFAYHDWTNGHLTEKPHCVYKGVMSDAEIELCTGHPVHYDYGIKPQSATGRAARRATSSS